MIPRTETPKNVQIAITVAIPKTLRPYSFVFSLSALYIGNRFDVKAKQKIISVRGGIISKNIGFSVDLGHYTSAKVKGSPRANSDLP